MRPGTEAASLLNEWRTIATVFREHEETPVALAYERCADALEKALRVSEETPLTLTEAAKLSGYSADHLGRLVRDGKIRNAGRPGAPRIARGDLPRKSGHIASVTRTREIDFKQIVRSAITEGAA
jgi:hypothetical protein